MSADNYIFIDRKKKPIEVWACVASCVCNHKKHCLKCQKSYLIGKADTLEEAVFVAEQNDNYENEYGISFNLWCK